MTHHLLSNKNFFAGPGKMPPSVLSRLRDEMTNYAGTGLSVMEWSHRSPPIEALLDRVLFKLRTLLHIPASSDVLLLQGGGTLQFHMVPMNLSVQSDPVDYLDTGYWAQKAIDAGRSLKRDVRVVAKSHTSIPSVVAVRPQAKYLHLCTNNTVMGTQWKKAPAVPVPVVADMSSDILSDAQDINAYDLVYAHAQKTVGTAGVTIVVLNERVRKQIPDGLPPFFDYRTHARAGSNYHTPPVFSIYVMDCMLDWIVNDIGGLAQLGELNARKAQALYQVLDRSSLYRCPVSPDSRSVMNVVFDITEPALATRFSEAARQHGFLGLDGHRSRGGFRASLYNAVTLEEVQSLCEFMQVFERG
jgi:phosphoserine aminotransferase